jgi:hypothetical protein
MCDSQTGEHGAGAMLPTGARPTVVRGRLRDSAWVRLRRPGVTTSTRNACGAATGQRYVNRGPWRAGTRPASGQRNVRVRCA